MKFVKDLSLSSIELSLSFLFLGLIFIDYKIFSYFLVLVSLFIFLILILKLLYFPKEASIEHADPMVAGVFPGFSIYMIIFPVFTYPYFPRISSFICFFGIVAQIVLMLDFSINYLFNFEFENLFPSWLITYTGLASVTITQYYAGFLFVQKVFFYLSFIFFISFTLLLIRKYIKKPVFRASLMGMPQLLTPPSLLLLCFVMIYDKPNLFLLISLYSISTAIYIFILTKISRLFRIKFMPSFYNFTFPLVVRSFANLFLIEIWPFNRIPFFKTIIFLELFISIFFIGFISIRTIQYLKKN